MAQYVTDDGVDVDVDEWRLYEEFLAGEADAWQKHVDDLTRQAIATWAEDRGLDPTSIDTVEAWTEEQVAAAEAAAEDAAWRAGCGRGWS